MILQYPRARTGCKSQKAKIRVRFVYGCLGIVPIRSNREIENDYLPASDLRPLRIFIVFVETAVRTVNMVKRKLGALEKIEADL